MRRRDLLRAAGAAAAAALAGCSQGEEPPSELPRGPPEPGEDGGGAGGGAGGGGDDGDGGDDPGTIDDDEIHITTIPAAPNLAIGAGYDYRAVDNETLRVVVPVENDGNATGRAVLRVNVSTGDDYERQDRLVELEPGENRTLSLDFSLSPEAFRTGSGNGISFDWVDESVATLTPDEE